MKKILILLVYLLLIQLSPAFCDQAKQELASTMRDQVLSGGVNFISRNYILGPNDVINIAFFGVPEFEQKELRIQPNGVVSLPAVGTLQVAGLSIDELSSVLEEKYKFYLEDPQISINLIEAKPFIVYITGAVINPGSYEMNTNTNKSQYIGNSKPEANIERKTPLLSNVLVAAGGIQHDADLEHIQITNSFTRSKMEVNLFELLQTGDANQDIYLVTGDTVYVPKLPTAYAVNPDKYKLYAASTFSPRSVPVKVIGYVNTPGLVKLDPGQSLNLNSAIALAGGYLKESAYIPKKVYLSRVDSSGKITTTVINPMSNDIILMPNDIVYVPEKLRPTAGKVFDYIGRIVYPVSSIAGAYNNWALIFDPTRNRY